MKYDDDMLTIWGEWANGEYWCENADAKRVLISGCFRVIHVLFHIFNGSFLLIIIKLKS